MVRMWVATQFLNTCLLLRLYRLSDDRKPVEKSLSTRPFYTEGDVINARFRAPLLVLHSKIVLLSVRLTRPVKCPAVDKIKFCLFDTALTCTSCSLNTDEQSLSADTRTTVA